MNTIINFLSLFDSLIITKEQVIATIDEVEYLIGGNLFDRMMLSNKFVYRIPESTPIIVAQEEDIPIQFTEYTEWNKDYLRIKIPAFRNSK